MVTKTEKFILHSLYRRTMQDVMTYEEWLEEQYLKLLKEHHGLLEQQYEPTEKEIQKIMNTAASSAEEAKEALMETKGDIMESIRYIIKKRNEV